MPYDQIDVSDIQIQFTSIILAMSQWVKIVDSNPDRIAIYYYTADGKPAYFVPGGGSSPVIGFVSFAPTTQFKQQWTLESDGPVVHLDFWLAGQSNNKAYAVEVIRIPRPQPLPVRRIYTSTDMGTEQFRRQSYLDRLEKILNNLRVTNGILQ